MKPDVAIFNSMIAACAHGGEHAKARAMFDSMAEHGCAPDAVTYANPHPRLQEGRPVVRVCHFTRCSMHPCSLCSKCVSHTAGCRSSHEVCWSFD